MVAAAELLERMQEVIRQVFDDDSIEITATTTADEIDGWDSVVHINIIVAVEKEFRVRLSTAEIASTKSAGKDVGMFLALVASKMK